MTPLEKLARLRTLSARESSEVVRLGKEVLSSRARLGEQEWPIREQITIAALDVGDIQLAESQISLLSRRFPSSPRLLILQALHLESLGKYTSARIVYRCLLGRREGVEGPRLGLDGVDAAAPGEKDGAEQGQGRAGLGIARGEVDDGTEGVKVMALWKGEPDECFVTAHQRLITLALYPPPSSSSTTTATAASCKTTPTPSSEGIKAALPLLTRYLDTFHSDPEAWSLLADLYVVSSAGLSPPLSQQTTSSGWGIDALFANGTTHLLTLQTTLQTSASKPPSTDASYIPQALQSLAQQILLEPWSPRPLIRFGELYLLSNDIETAFRTLLRSVEMTSEPFVGGNDPRAGDGDVQAEYEKVVVAGGEKGWREVVRVGGWKTRVWWDLALCTTILAHPSYNAQPSSPSTPVSTTQVAAVRKLVVMRLEALLGAPGVVEQWERGLLGA